MSFDIFAPQVSVVAKGLEGKVITIYGSNNLGKTKQATRMKKPYYFPFEKGLNAISGVPFLPINSWSDFKKITKQFAKNTEKAKEMYQTLIIDEVEAMAKYCAKYVCGQFGVERIKDGNSGYGLWNEYETELWEEINKLLGLGFTLVFIAHQETDKEGKIRPKGNKRALGPVIDNSDVVVHLQSNGVDEEGKVIKSSAYFAETNEFFARSRFDHIDTYLEEFTAENLEEVIVEAIKRQEEAEGVKAVSFEEQKTTYTSDALDYDELMEQIKAAGIALTKADRGDELAAVVEKHLGVGKKVTECKKNQIEVMSVILDDLKDLLDERE